MNIELKNIKYSSFASQETSCFQATIYIEGKKEGTVENDGQGGCNFYHPSSVGALLNDYATTLPKIKYGEDEFCQDADCLINDLLMNHLYEKDLKKSLSKRIMFVGQDGKLRETVGLDKTRMTALLASPTLSEKLKSHTILNLLPFCEAIKIYRSQVAH